VLTGIEGQHFSCGGSVTYGNKAMKCWIADKGGAHGSLDLSDAIMQSCNCFFYQYGNRAGISAIGKVGKMLGVGEKTGIELEDESPGILPSREWMQLNAPNGNWRSPGHIANTSIGQGKVTATPLQMASVAATVANSGKSYRPHLLKKIMQGDKLVEELPPPVRSDLATEGIDPKHRADPPRHVEGGQRLGRHRQGGQDPRVAGRGSGRQDRHGAVLAHR